MEQIIVNTVKGRHKEAEHLARNPFGTVPTLELDDGSFIVESLAIIEFLEDFFPEHRLMPADPIARGHARDVERVIDLRLAGPMGGYGHAELAARLSEGSGEGRGVAGCDAGAARLPGRTARRRAPIAHGGSRSPSQTARSPHRSSSCATSRRTCSATGPAASAWDERHRARLCTSLGAALVAGGQKSFASTDSCHGEP